jgi:DNA-binding Lrp family transcriptional regulator
VRRSGSATRTTLKVTQERVLDALRMDGATPLTRARYQEIAGVSRSQAAYDLAELVEAGILERFGAGPATRYRLADFRPDDRRRWTNERIRSALQEFCAGREAWPSAREFKGAGHHDLYVAASRYGGIPFWAKELGFARPGRRPAPTRIVAPSRRRRPRMRWTAEAAAMAVALGVAGVSVLHPWNTSSDLRSGAASAPNPRGPVTVVHVKEKGSATTVKVKPPAKAKQLAQARRAPSRSGTSSATNQLVVQRTRSVPSHVSSQRKTTTTSASVASSTRAPMQAPTASAAPSPLPPPGG